jgi:spore maturation protein CgeB
MIGPKILVGYPYFRSSTYGDVEQMVLTYLRRLQTAGFDVEGFCLTLDPPGPRLRFPDLDRRWRRGDPELLGMYDRLQAKLEGKDVFLNDSGINLHPEFVENLRVLTVYQCYDDPESSADLSRPVAASYDLCLVGNIAEVETYRSWGVRRAEWRPMGLQPEIYDPALTREQILDGDRDLDLFMMLDRQSPWRKQRVEKLAAAFPDAHFYGDGWPKGFLPADRQIEYLKRAKIGPNIHNSTGPINYRTFYLPANGVLQVCDNKGHLAKIYELGKEAVGFDSIEECIELCRYYMAHDDERRQLAAAGWDRVMRDYTEVAIFRRIVALMSEMLPAKRAPRTLVPNILTAQSDATRLRRMVYPLERVVRHAGAVGVDLVRRVLRR